MDIAKDGAWLALGTVGALVVAGVVQRRTGSGARRRDIDARIEERVYYKKRNGDFRTIPADQYDRGAHGKKLGGHWEIEIVQDGMVYGVADAPGSDAIHSWKSRAEAEAFLDSLRAGGPMPPLVEMYELDPEDLDPEDLDPEEEG
jgi:hypothetical protein